MKRKYTYLRTCTKFTCSIGFDLKYQTCFISHRDGFLWKIILEVFFLKEEYLLLCRVEISIMSIEITKVEKKTLFQLSPFSKDTKIRSWRLNTNYFLIQYHYFSYVKNMQVKLVCIVFISKSNPYFLTTNQNRSLR